MSSETTVVAEQCRLQEWAATDRSCKTKDSVCGRKNSSDAQPGLNISTKGFSVHVTESIPTGLLAAVLEVIRDAE